MERTLDHAQKAASYGCNGLLAVHWRTAELAPEFAALQSAAWDEHPTASNVFQRWANASFGPQVGAEMASILLSLDSWATGTNLSATSFPITDTKLPRVAQACCGKFVPCWDLAAGPCNAVCPGVNPTCPVTGFEFVTKMAALRATVKGKSNAARLEVWYNSFLYFSRIVTVEELATKLTESLANMTRPNATQAEKHATALAALPKLVALSRAWDLMTTSLQQTVTSSGTLGTLATNDANMRLRVFPFASTVAALRSASVHVPASALPSTHYLGPDRLLVRTIRTTAMCTEETLTIKATLLTADDSTLEHGVSLHWRTLGSSTGKWHSLVGKRCGGVSRGVFSFVVQLSACGATEDLEWYVEAAAGGLFFPAGWEDAQETVTVVVV